MSSQTPLLELLSTWMPFQRWYAGKGREPRLRVVGGWSLPGRGERIHTYLVLDESANTPTLYQVPITDRPLPLDEADDALIGTLADEQGELHHLYDGPRDPAFAEALLELAVLGGETTPAGAQAHAVALAEGRTLDVLASRVLSGEQSNTSIIYDLGGGHGTEQVICKVFRALHHGENPDVVLQSALAAAGSMNVPRSIGAVVAEWDDAGRPGGRAVGHAAFAQEFIPGAEDAWRYALRAAESGEDFTGKARALGAVTAQVHAALADVLPVRAAGSADIEATLASWYRRLELAVDEVPAIGEFRDLIDRLYESVRQVPWPSLQRIHGDYHLGQVLAAPDGRWILLDFEGEPLRPMEERSQLDFPVRDVAGMLRSFDYVAGALGGGEADEWAASSRDAFLDGYVVASGTDVLGGRVLLDAFEVDKAIYEAVYEARNRPDWLPIPTAALRRLAERARAALA